MRRGPETYIDEAGTRREVQTGDPAYDLKYPCGTSVYLIRPDRTIVGHGTVTQDSSADHRLVLLVQDEKPKMVHVDAIRIRHPRVFPGDLDFRTIQAYEQSVVAEQQTQSGLDMHPDAVYTREYVAQAQARKVDVPEDSEPAVDYSATISRLYSTIGILERRLEISRTSRDSYRTRFELLREFRDTLRRADFDLEAGSPVANLLDLVDELLETD